MVTSPLAGWPYPGRSIGVGGHTMAYVDEGAGPPVLLVHGNPTWSFYYRSLLAALPPLGLRAIAPDHIGMGRSDKPSADAYPHTLRRRVEDLGAFIDGLGLTGPISLVVHDWGGAIALAWAVDNAHRVDNLVLLNTGAFPLPPDKSLPWTLRAARLPVLGDIAVRRLNAFSLGALVLGSAHVGPRYARSNKRKLLGPAWVCRGAGSAERCGDLVEPGELVGAEGESRRVEQRLHLLQDIPTLICWGMRDPVFDGVVLDHLVSLLPRADVHRFADAGHYVLEDAADRIVPLVTRLLAP